MSSAEKVPDMIWQSKNRPNRAVCLIYLACSTIFGSNARVEMDIKGCIMGHVYSGLCKDGCGVCGKNEGGYQD